MPNAEHIFVDTRIPLSEIEIRMNALRAGAVTPSDKRALDRLGFIHLRYNGFSVESASEVVGISRQTGYNWQRAWNENGLDSVIPGFSGGRPRRISPEQMERLVADVNSGRMTTSEARSYIADEFGISYSEKQVHEILAGAGMRHVSRKATGIRVSEDRPAEGRMVWILRGHCSSLWGNERIPSPPFFIYGNEERHRSVRLWTRAKP